MLCIDLENYFFELFSLNKTPFNSSCIYYMQYIIQIFSSYIFAFESYNSRVMTLISLMKVNRYKRNEEIAFFAFLKMLNKQILTCNSKCKEIFAVWSEMMGIVAVYHNYNGLLPSQSSLRRINKYHISSKSNTGGII